jgi:hypothetical protein
MQVVLDVVTVEVDQSGENELAVGFDHRVGIVIDVADSDDAIPLSANAAVDHRIRRDDTATDDGDAFFGRLCGRTHSITTSPS